MWFSRPAIPIFVKCIIGFLSPICNSKLLGTTPVLLTLCRLVITSPVRPVTYLAWGERCLWDALLRRRRASIHTWSLRNLDRAQEFHVGAGIDLTEPTGLGVRDEKAYRTALFNR